MVDDLRINHWIIATAASSLSSHPENPPRSTAAPRLVAVGQEVAVVQTIGDQPQSGHPLDQVLWRALAAKVLR